MSPHASDIPLKPMPNVMGTAPMWRWLHALGTGAPDPGVEVERSALVASGIRWVLFEPDRCEAEHQRRADPDELAHHPLPEQRRTRSTIPMCTPSPAAEARQ